MRFDLSSIKTGTKINSANLYLFANTCTAIQGVNFTNGTITITPFTSSWDPNKISWINCPAYSSTSIAKGGSAQVNVWESFNLTNYVNGIINNGQPNYGFMIVFNVTSGKFGTGISSGWCTDDSLKRPMLILNYEGTSPDIQAPTGSITAPVKGTILKPSTPAIITWSATDNISIVSRALYFSSDSAKTWSKIDSSSGNTGSFTWNVPVISSTKCFIRIDAYDAAKNKGSFVSGQFSISSTIIIMFNTDKINMSKEYNVTLFNIQGKTLKSFKLKELSLINKMVPIGLTIAKINGQKIKIIKQ